MKDVANETSPCHTLPPPPLATPLATQKEIYMALEIERKFLVHKDFLPELREGKFIIQGYLSERPSVRFRIIGSEVILGIKEYLTGGTRFELETPSKVITSDEIEKLQELAISPPISKTRYNVEHESLIWEIDVYQGDNLGLITVDVELPYHDYPLIFPKWVDESNEITGNSVYSNINLGKHPFNHWNLK